MSVRSREQILQKIEYFEKLLTSEQCTEWIEYLRGSLSSLYYVLKMKNPYTGYDMGRAE